MSRSSGSVEFGSAAEEEAALVSVPPYHVAGVAAIVSSVYSGRRIVQLPNFTADGWIDLARKERVSIATAGVGIGPSKKTSIPTAVKPDTRAASSM